MLFDIFSIKAAALNNNENITTIQNQLDKAQINLEEADKKIQKAQISVDNGKALYNEGSYAFFYWLKTAGYLAYTDVNGNEKTGTSPRWFLENAKYKDYIQKGNEISATSIKNLLAALDFLDKANEIRKSEGLCEYRITWDMMAMV